MVKKATVEPTGEGADDRQSAHKTAKIGFWGTVAAAVIAGVVTLTNTLITKPKASDKPVVTASPSAETRTPIRFDTVDHRVGLCNTFNGTGDWNPAAFDLLVFNRPWDAQKKVGTGDYYLDGAAKKAADGSWKGPHQEIGRDTEAGFAVEVSAVLVSHAWAEFLLDKVTAPAGQYWASKDLPPHEAVATLVVTRDGTDGGC
ncbi:hypothetical protein [Paractinoplanes lichenicola]|uniref:Uncharacterized protein n=1 Tax=Paractinoplanes lichenicola TaxID=2802976 RepID=A0ABS1W487_9ACTN|nr:hypothetical protein [Actinoplanes lichenicola]MBL7261378.1 hypothetical protein [Actinoplanes lichenicola]